MPDMHGMTFTVNIPVFYRNKQREELRQTQEEGLSAAMPRQPEERTNFDLKQIPGGASLRQTCPKLFSEGVVPQSSLALESSMSAYQVGTVDFLCVIGNFTIVLNYEIDYYRELANYQTSLARIEALTGVELCARPGAGTPQAPEREKEYAMVLQRRISSRSR